MKKLVTLSVMLAVAIIMVAGLSAWILAEEVKPAESVPAVPEVTAEVKAPAAKAVAASLKGIDQSEKNTVKIGDAGRYFIKEEKFIGDPSKAVKYLLQSSIATSQQLQQVNVTVAKLQMLIGQMVSESRGIGGQSQGQ